MSEGRVARGPRWSTRSIPSPQSLAAVLGPLTLAAVLRLWDLGNVGFGNQYYAATVKSMLRSPLTFLYASFDPEGFVSVDKPPLGLWTQALLAKLVGFSGLVLQLPQVIAGTIGVAVLGWIVARDFGRGAGVTAALVAAVMPVAVAVDRNNTMDAQLLLLLVVATYAVLRATQRGPLRWLVLAGALVGLAFNVKMAQAYLPVPAFLLAYVMGSRAPVLARVAHVVVFTVVALAVSLAWIAFVDLTPPDERPYVGSSRNNSALELALNHNGAARLPQELMSWLRPAAPQSPSGVPVPLAGPPQPPQPPPPPPGALGPNDEAGERGALRLFNRQLAGQVSWFAPLALLGGVAAFGRDGRRWPLTRAQAAILLWTVWLLSAAILFSWSGIFHRYYLVMLAPPLAALCGAGCGALLGLARTRWGRILIACVVLLTAFIELRLISDAGDFAPWLLPVVAVATLTAFAVPLVAVMRSRLVTPLGILSLFGFMVAPLLWATTAIVAPDAGLPYAGPELLRRGRPLPPPPGRAAPQGVLAFLLQNRAGERWIVATGSTGPAASLMLQSDVAVMALGGFSGGDRILTPSALDAKVRGGEVRFAILGDRMPGELERWLRASCVVVTRAPPFEPPGQPGALVDCKRGP